MSYWMAGATIGGAALGYLGNKQSAGAAADANDQNTANYQAYLEANKDTGKKVWTDEQDPYVFGQAWNPQMPAVNPQALEWNAMVGAGGQPGVERLQNPMSLGQIQSQMPGQNNGQFGQGLSNLLGFGSQGPQPLYLDPTTGQPGLTGNQASPLAASQASQAQAQAAPYQPPGPPVTVDSRGQWLDANGNPVSTPLGFSGYGGRNGYTDMYSQDPYGGMD